MKNGDFSRTRGRAGATDRHLRPGHGPRRQRRLDARSVPGQHNPGGSHHPTARAIMQVLAGPELHDGRRRAVAEQPGLWPEHFNKDLFWNWVGKVDHNFSANDRVFFRWGENERNEIGNRGNAIRSGPARTASFRSGAPTARSSATGCTSSAPGRCSTCAPATLTSSSGAIRSSRTASIRRSSGPSSLVSQMPSQAIGGIFPRIRVPTS